MPSGSRGYPTSYRQPGSAGAGLSNSPGSGGVTSQIFADLVGRDSRFNQLVNGQSSYTGLDRRTARVIHRGRSDLPTGPGGPRRPPPMPPSPGNPPWKPPAGAPGGTKTTTVHGRPLPPPSKPPSGIGAALGIGAWIAGSFTGAISRTGRETGPGVTKWGGRYDPDKPTGWVLTGSWSYAFPWHMPPVAQFPASYHDGPDGLTGQSLAGAQPFGTPTGANQMVWMTTNDPAAPAIRLGAVTHAFYREVDLGPDDLPGVIDVYIGAGPEPVPSFGPAIGVHPAPASVGGLPLPIPWGLVPYARSGDGVPGTNQGGYSPPAPASPEPEVTPQVLTWFGGGPPIVGTQPPPIRQPPRKNEREQKTIAGIPPKSVLGILISATTEGMDFVEVLWSALPKSIRGKDWYWNKKRGQWERHTTFQQRMEILWNNLDKVDVGAALSGVIANHVEDYLLGRISSTTDRNFREWYNRSGRPVGVGFGPAL